MPGTKITLNTEFTDNTLPRIQFDSILPITGAVLLFDPSHPENPVTAPVAHGLALPNLAAEQATAMGASGALGGEVGIGASFIGPLGFVERSAKGGLHFAIGATLDAVNRSAFVRGSTGLVNLLNANKTHSFYHSAWSRVTRMQSNEGTANAIISQIGDTSERQLAHFYTQPTGIAAPPVYPQNARLTSSFTYGAAGSASIGTVSPASTGPVMWAGATSAFTTNIVVSADSLKWNTVRAGWSPQVYGVSTIFYRAYVEDLTVSGRTFAQVQALDFAEFTKQVLTVGGRYYNDTFTAPPA